MGREYTRELVQEAVDRSTSWSSLIRNLDLTVAGGNFTQTKRRVADYGIDTSHFTGQGWSKDMTVDTDGRVASTTRKIRKWTDAEKLSKNGPKQNGTKLRKLMRKHGFDYACLICHKPPEVRNLPLTLQVDHRNGNNSDNRIENLRFLCPDCHSQQATSNHNRRVQEIIKYVEADERGFVFYDTVDYNLFFKNSGGNFIKYEYTPGKGIPTDIFDSIVVVKFPAQLGIGAKKIAFTIVPEDGAGQP